MLIPSSRLDRFAAELIEQCLVSRRERIARGAAYKSVYQVGAEDAANMAIYNKTFAYIDDLVSLLYSPVGLRWNIEHYGSVGPVDRAKAQAAASYIHSLARRSDLDTMTSDAVEWALVKGKSFIKLLWGSTGLTPALIQPEMMGVLQENLTELDANMEAFVHSTYITPYQFSRIIYRHHNKAELERKAKKYMKPTKGDDPRDDNAMKQIVVGGLYPYQPSGSPMPNTTRGVVDWMSGGAPMLDPKVLQSLIRLDELWVWDDKREDWATFQMISPDMMIMGQDFVANAFAFDPGTAKSNPELKGQHPFKEFCPNRSVDYFWGRSEIQNVFLLQTSINSRINGINGLLRLQEQPPKKFIGATSVNQAVISRMNKPGGYFSDPNPNAKVENMAPQLPDALGEWLHENERMFDEMGGLPPIAKGRGESGVRSQGHAETLVRMFSPRFKDRALLVERDVESCGATVLDLCKAHVAEKLTAWIHKDDAVGIGATEAQASAHTDITRQPPAPGLIPIDFSFSDIGDNARVSVDAHSSSPAFAMEARQLMFDLFKIGAASPEDVVHHVDAPDPEGLIAGMEKRAVEQAAFLEQHPELAAKAAHGKKH